MAGQPHLPIEVCEVVIDFVAAETSTLIPAGLAPQYQLRQRHLDLIACAQTCRSWLPRCAYHLSTRIHIASRSRMERTVEVFKADPIRSSLIRTVYICSPPRPYNPAEHEGAFSSWSHLLPFRMGGVFPHLEKLVLVDLNWQNLHSSFFLLAPKLTCTVTTLCMHGLHFESPWKLASILDMFSSLHDLTIVGAEFPSGRLRNMARRGSNRPNRPCTVSSLRSVTIRRTSDIAPVLSWLSSLESAALLESLRLDISEPMEALQKLLIKCAGLSRLDLDFGPSIGSNVCDFIEALDVSNIVGLRSLYVAAGNNCVASLAAPLSNLAGHMTRDITIRLQNAIAGVGKFVSNTRQAWAALDSALANRDFAELQEVTIVMKTLATEHGSAIQDLLPLTYARGVLQLKILDMDDY